MEAQEEAAQESLDSSFGPDSPLSPPPPPTDPLMGVMDPEDTLELLRDALRQGQGFEHLENLTMTERMNLTSHSALQPFSYDVHVKLGMELMALRRQEANQRLDAEQFGEQLKRRAFVRDMLKRVAKEDNWVQYPASDLERISRALDRRDSKEEDEGKAKGENPSYGKWLERRKKANSNRRTAFGSTILPKGRKAKGQEAIAEAAAALDAAAGAAPGRARSKGTARISQSGGAMLEGEDAVAVTTFGMAPRLMGPMISGGQSRRSLSPTGVRRINDATRIKIHSRGAPQAGGGMGLLGEAEGDEEEEDEDDEEEEEGESDESGEGDGDSRRGPFAEMESQVIAVRFQSDMDDDDDDNGRKQLASAAEILGLGGGGKDGRRGGMYGRTQSELLSAAADALSGLDVNDPRGNKLGWRAVLKRNRASAASAASAHPSVAATAADGGVSAGGVDGGGDVATATDQELAAVENPLLALRLSVRRELSYRAPPPTAAPPGGQRAAAAGLALDEPRPIPEVEAPLGELEDAVKAVASIRDEMLDAFAKAMEAAAAAAASVAAMNRGADGGGDGAAADDAAAAEAAVAAASAEVEALAEELSVRLDAAREEYSLAHAAKLESITAISDLNRQLQLLREWIDGRGQKRLAAAAAALNQQHDRLAAAAGGGGAVAAAAARSPAVARLMEDVGLAAEELENMAAAVEAAAGEAATGLEERERRRAALRLIEEECVQLAEEMAAREETERLAAIMKAEAEAEQRMAEAKDDDEARRHALLAAMLMGQEEWVLEKEARLAALRAAERDEKRLALLRAAEQDKARAAEAAGNTYDRSLLTELNELGQAAKREAELRRKRLDEALAELSHFEEMLRRQQQAAAAAAAAAASGAAAAVPLPAASDASPEALLRAALAAVRECVSKATAEAEAAGSGTGTGPVEAEAEAAPSPSSGDEVKQAAGAQEGGGGSQLDQASQAARARLAEARAGLEASRRAASWGVAAAPAGAASAASSAAPSAAPSRAVSRTASFMARQDAEAGSGGFRAAQQELREEQERLAALVGQSGAVLRGRSRQLLQAVMEECDGLVAAVAAAEGDAAEGEGEDADGSTAPSGAPSSALESVPSAATAEGRGAADEVAAAGLDDAAAAAAAAAAPSAPAPNQPASLLQPALRTAALPLQPPASPSGALAPPVVRARASGPGIAPATVTLGVSPRADSPGRDWSLRPDPLAASSGDRPGVVALGSRDAPPPPPLPAVHPHSQSGAARIGGLSAKALQLHQQLQQPPHPQQLQPGTPHTPPLHQHHHSPAGLVPPYGRAPALQGQAPGQAQVQGLLPVVTTPETPSSGARRGVLHTGRAGLLGSTAAGTPDFLPPISVSAPASHSPTVLAAGATVALAAPPPTPRAITLDGTAATPTPRAPSPTGMSPVRHPSQLAAAVAAPPQMQQQSQSQPHVQTTLWPSAAMESRHTRSFPASPEPLARAVPASSSTTQPARRGAAAAAGGGSAAPGAGAAAPTTARQALAANTGAVSGPVGPHAPRRLEQAAEERAGATASPARAPAHVSPAAAAARSAATAAGLPPAAAQSLGDVPSYSQWISAASPPHLLTPRALDAARQVDEALSRLPPELHSVLLNAAELLTLETGGHEPVQMAPGGAAGGGGGGGSVPAHLQTLPPVVSRYILSQLQRIYNASSGGGSSGSSGGGGVGKAGSGGGAAGGVVGGDGGSPGLGSDQSLAALELLNQLLPAIAHGVAQVVRTRVNGGGSGGGAAAAAAAAAPAGAAAAGAAAGGLVPFSVVAAEAARCPMGTGAMHGSPLKSSRRARSMPCESGDGGSSSSASSSASVAGGPMSAAAPAAATAAAVMGSGGGLPQHQQQQQGPRVRRHTLTLSTQAAQHAPVAPAAANCGAGGGGGGNQRRGLAGAVTKSSKNGCGAGGEPRQRDSIELDRWMIRGVNVQVNSRTSGHQQQHADDGPTSPGGMVEGGGGAVGGARDRTREAFLPPLGQGHKLTAVRH